MEGSLEKEYVDLARPDSSVWEEQIQTANTITLGKLLTVPPTPPAKDITVPSPARPAPLHLSSNIKTGNNTLEAPSRPPPQVPVVRPLPLRVAPLGMNPPTRPGTANTEKSKVQFGEAQTRIIGSNKRLSWSSIETSKRPIKYGKGKFNMVELNPQPSDDPDDPLVSPYLPRLRRTRLMFIPELATMEEGAELGSAPPDGVDDRRDEDRVC
jgi:hypothetical protein